MGKTRFKIEVQKPGGIPGKTSGDIIDDPTKAQIERARDNPGCARLIETKPSKGGGVEREGTEDGTISSQTRRHRKNLESDR